MTTNALRYWERRRLVFNGVLAAIILLRLFSRWLEPAYSRQSPSSEIAFPVRWLIILAVNINIAYCSVYVADIFVQMSDFRSKWLEYRWIMLVVMIIYALAVYVY